MPEAPPSSPGHVGHTPQHTAEIWRRARLEGQLTANQPHLRAQFGEIYAMQTFRQLQRFVSQSSSEAIARARDYARRVGLGGVDPQPPDFFSAFSDPRLTRRNPSP